MVIEIRQVLTPAERRQFVQFPWQVNRGDPNWVPPLIEDRLAKIDPLRNSFWRTAGLALWLAFRDGACCGTIAGIVDRHGIETLGEPVGNFGFFECENRPETARALFDTAAGWLHDYGCIKMRGPYNPSPFDETGVLVEGFDTRPALLMGHNPKYYPGLFEQNGFIKYNDLLARLVRRPEGGLSFDKVLPEKLARVAQKAAQRPDLRIRAINMKAWDAEIHLACEIYNRALNDLPGYVPISENEFQEFAASFKPLIDTHFALIAEIAGKPVAFALALPDINEALQHVNGRLDLPGNVRFWWYSRRLKRISFKIMMVLPEYQNRGLESVLGTQIAQAIWNGGYQEVDFSLTGEENTKSTTFQEHLGFQPYRRYRIFQKML